MSGREPKKKIDYFSIIHTAILRLFLHYSAFDWGYKYRPVSSRLLDWFQDVTGFPPVMWGSSIIGYGRYHCVYDSGRSGDSLMTGFSPRKSSLSIYIMPGYHDLDIFLQKPGKHKAGKSCLFINKLADIDMNVLEDIVLHGVRYLQANYETWRQ